MTSTWSIGVGSSSKNFPSRSKSVASKAAVLRAPSSRAARCEAIRVARGENQLGSFGARSPGRFEPDAHAAADHDDGLPGEFRFALQVIYTHGRSFGPSLEITTSGLLCVT